MPVDCQRIGRIDEAEIDRGRQVADIGQATLDQFSTRSSTGVAKKEAFHVSGSLSRRVFSKVTNAA